jgi:hypothetical protein
LRIEWPKAILKKRFKTIRQCVSPYFRRLIAERFSFCRFTITLWLFQTLSTSKINTFHGKFLKPRPARSMALLPLGFGDRWLLYPHRLKLLTVDGNYHARRLPELTSRPWNDWKIQNLGYGGIGSLQQFFDRS